MIVEPCPVDGCINGKVCHWMYSPDGLDRYPGPEEPCETCGGTGWVKNPDFTDDEHWAVTRVGVHCPRCRKPSHLSHPIRWWQEVKGLLGQCAHGCGDSLVVPLDAVELHADYCPKEDAA